MYIYTYLLNISSKCLNITGKDTVVNDAYVMEMLEKSGYILKYLVLMEEMLRN